MSNLSLQKSIQGCKVSTDWALRQQSARFLDSNNLLCPLWNGLDNTGRAVCPDSFNTKSVGCNSPLDRVMVENEQRPKYFQYLTLNASGLHGGDGKDSVVSGRTGGTGGTGLNGGIESYIGTHGADVGSVNRAANLRRMGKSTPAYGQNLQSIIKSGGCATRSYSRAINNDDGEYRRR